MRGGQLISSGVSYCSSGFISLKEAQGSKYITEHSYTHPNMNLHNYDYYPKPKYLIIGSFGPLGGAESSSPPGRTLGLPAFLVLPKRWQHFNRRKAVSVYSYTGTQDPFARASSGNTVEKAAEPRSHVFCSIHLSAPTVQSHHHRRLGGQA